MAIGCEGLSPKSCCVPSKEIAVLSAQNSARIFSLPERGGRAVSRVTGSVAQVKGDFSRGQGAASRAAAINGGRPVRVGRPISLSSEGRERVTDLSLPSGQVAAGASGRAGLSTWRG